MRLNGITQYNDKRFSIGRYKHERTTIPALRAGWRQIAAATVGVPYWGLKGFTRVTENCQFRQGAKKPPRFHEAVISVGITYLPGKSPCKYCRRGRA